MRVLKGQDLMQGSDHEFIVKLYRRILLRGADEGGYRHYRDKIEADPGCRRRLIEEMAGSSEARRQGEELRIIWDDAPTPPKSAPEALLEALRQRLRSLDDASLAALEASLVECLEALRAARRKSLEPGA
ncbi:MAG: DUF4214 domain-containing protein [Acetobacteraceae bacterium]|nr:DUF4214 domain-containing protein [Acetobacteraceae bacterium]